LIIQILVFNKTANKVTVNKWLFYMIKFLIRNRRLITQVIIFNKYISLN